MAETLKVGITGRKHRARVCVSAAVVCVSFQGYVWGDSAQHALSAATYTAAVRKPVKLEAKGK